MVEAFIGQHRAVIDRALHAALVDAFVAKDEPILAGISRRLYSAHCGGAEEMLRAENNELKLKLEQAQAECEEKEAVIARLSCRKLTERAAVDFTRDSPAMSVDSRKLESDALAFLSGFDRLDDEPRSLWASVRRDLSDVARIEGARDSGSRSTAMSMAWLDSIPSGRASTQRPDSSCQSANTTSMAASEAVCQRALEAARAKLAVVEPPPSASSCRPSTRARPRYSSFSYSSSARRILASTSASCRPHDGHESTAFQFCCQRCEPQ